jgi:hypothetical protein
MSIATETAGRPAKNTLLSKIAEFGVFVASTLLLLETREWLDEATSGDKSDGAYIQGM